MSEIQVKKFEEELDLDFACELPDGSARFRVNVFFQRGEWGLVLRLIPSSIPNLSELDVPEVLSELMTNRRGLILMVGGTGSGKSTTLAAMINHRNENFGGHILTIEDPIEFSHKSLKSIVNQREVGVDTKSYHAALRSAMREAPDVIMIGEIRDRETMETTMELCNTGHLAISTMAQCEPSYRENCKSLSSKSPQAAFYGLVSQYAGGHISAFNKRFRI